MITCKNDNSKVFQKGINTNSYANIIKYLKANFHIEIDTSKIEVNYRKHLLETAKSLETDSLIGSRIFINEYKPLNLSFIYYDNYFGISDTSSENHFSVNLIEDRNTGTFYIDYINDKAGIINEDYCMWSYMQNLISKGEAKNVISDENIKAYNSINSSRVFGENEIRFGKKKMGIQSYLNSVNRFSRPTKLELDSLFYNYDRLLCYRRDTLLGSINELYSFLRVQAVKIRSENNYGNLSQRLELLKSQINFILLQAPQTPNDNIFIWIYKSDSRLRVRRFQISGSKKSTYSYYIDEYQTCF